MTAPQSEYDTHEFSAVPLLTPAEVLAKMAAAEHASRLSMLGIIILSVVGVGAISLLFIFNKPDGAAAVSTMLIPTIASLLAYRKGAQNNRDLQEVRVSVDGRLSQLLKKTDSSARAEGHLEAAAQRKVRITDPTLPNGSPAVEVVPNTPEE